MRITRRPLRDFNETIWGLLAPARLCRRCFFHPRPTRRKNNVCWPAETCWIPIWRRNCLLGKSEITFQILVSDATAAKIINYKWSLTKRRKRYPRYFVSNVPTGCGKSLTYQALPILLDFLTIGSRRSEGQQQNIIFIVVSPLVSLMKD